MKSKISFQDCTFIHTAFLFFSSIYLIYKLQIRCTYVTVAHLWNSIFILLNERLISLFFSFLRFLRMSLTIIRIPLFFCFFFGLLRFLMSGLAPPPLYFQFASDATVKCDNIKWMVVGGGLTKSPYSVFKCAPVLS